MHTVTALSVTLSGVKTEKQYWLGRQLIRNVQDGLPGWAALGTWMRKLCAAAFA